MSTRLEIDRERREALSRHLLWLLDLVADTDDDLRTGRARLDRAARAFFASAGGGPRRDLLLGILALGQVLDAREVWLDADAPAALTRQLHWQLHWLVDGLDERARDRATRVLNPRGGLTPMRLRAEVYRYRRQLLWGATPAYKTTVRSAVPTFS